MATSSRDLRWLTLSIGAIALLSGCASDPIRPGQTAATSSWLVSPPSPSLLVAQQMFDQELRCSYRGATGEFSMVIAASESCPTEYFHAGEQWDAADRRF